MSKKNLVILACLLISSAAGTARGEARGALPDRHVRQPVLTGSSLFRPGETYWIVPSDNGGDPSCGFEELVEPNSTGCFAHTFQGVRTIRPDEGPPGCIPDNAELVLPAASASAALLPYLGQPLLSHFREQLAVLNSLPGGTIALSPTPVALIDTLDHRAVRRTGQETCPERVPGTSGGGHGQTMAGILHELACPEGDGGPCAAEVRYYQALDSETQQGSLIQLAWAICSAVEDWRRQELPRQPLILNLSLGWEPDPRIPLQTEVVRRALEYATCHGALPLAATGNLQVKELLQTQPEIGPLLPAAWAAEQARCKQFWDVEITDSIPLVYAVGAVDERNRPIAVSRPGGIPERVAFGLQVTSRWGTGQVTKAKHRGKTSWLYSDVLTGTSVGTAAASALAAVLGAYQPQAPPSQLMAWLDQGGLELDREADFFFGEEGPPRVRRLLLCQALEAACVQGGERCPATLPSCPELPTLPPEFFEQALTAFLADHGLAPGDEIPHPFYQDAGEQGLCPPDRERPDPATCTTQPPIIGCGGCFATRQHLVLDILSNYPAAMQEPELWIVNDDGTHNLSIDLPASLPAGYFAISNLSSIVQQQLQTAQAACLTYKLSGSNQLYFEQIGLGF